MCGLRLLRRSVPRDAIHIASGVVAQLDEEKCVGCGKCRKICPVDAIGMTEEMA